VTRAMSPAEIEGDYEIETGNAIVERFASIDPLEFPGVLVRGHAPFVWGRTVEAALETALALEAIAQMAYQTLALNPRIEPLDATLRDKHFLRKHGRDAYYGQPTASGDGSHIQPREGTHA